MEECIWLPNIIQQGFNRTITFIDELIDGIHQVVAYQAVSGWILPDELTSR
jgi:hypothetical protein